MEKAFKVSWRAERDVKNFKRKMSRKENVMNREERLAGGVRGSVIDAFN